MGLRVDLPNLVDIKEGILIAGKRQNGVVTGTGVDRRENRGRGTVLLKHDAGLGTAPTLDVVVQDSTDDVTYTTLAAATFAGFTQATTAAGVQAVAINLDAANRYIRARGTIAGGAGSGNGFTYTVSFVLPAGPDVPSPS